MVGIGHTFGGNSRTITVINGIKAGTFRELLVGSVDRLFVWAEDGEAQLTGQEVIHEIRKSFQIRDACKSDVIDKELADKRRRPLEFDVCRR
ncbi:hypothetical protein Tco_0923414 [Tanacetum coccineum]|uniref:Uncharacterized protein n=1 Tax=Tanacetum coccineum TaxID=301880 RepID=A0ABQ5D0V7_9ASTR